MRPIANLMLALSILTSVGCDSDEDNAPKPMAFSFEFSQDAQGWTADFADYPVGEEDFYELLFEYSTLPDPLDETDGALKISGNNHSDDLFMFVKRKVTGLAPNTTYNLIFNVEFASNVADGQFGVGGSPGEGVTIKAGASKTEPEKVTDDENNYRMNIDKANQTQGGQDMIVLGDFSNDTDQNVYTLKAVSNQTAFHAETNEAGELWLVVGTDSGFEATTTIYYNKIEAVLNPD